MPEALLSWTAGGLLLLAPTLRIIATPYVGSFAPIYHLTPFRMDLLCAGALVALVWRKDPGVIRKLSYAGKITVFVSAIALLLLSRFPWFKTTENSLVTNTLIYFLTLLIAVGSLTWALKGHGALSSFLSLPPLRYLGRVSYSMYLIHVTAILIVAKWFHNPWAVLFVSFAAALLYSAGSWHFLEKPILGVTRKKVAIPSLISAEAPPSY